MPVVVTHSTIKNDQKEVINYEIRIEGALIGHATKGEKGKFDFKAVNGAAPDLADQKTMRDLKVEVGKSYDKAFVKANRPAPKPKKATSASKVKPTPAEAAEKELDVASDSNDPGEDINLD